MWDIKSNIASSYANSAPNWTECQFLLYHLIDYAKQMQPICWKTLQINALTKIYHSIFTNIFIVSS